ncbi:Nnf1-domain-containing protein [Cladorrhinum sp. PSN332]|nr:Nnf1-domain-containing protein [Cladorrhinum sp. PSN332]
MSTDQDPPPVPAPASEVPVPGQGQDQDTEMANAPPLQAQAQARAGQPSQAAPPTSDPAPSDPVPSDQPEPEPQPAEEKVVPGPRATYLQNLFAQAAKHTLDKLSSPANFASCFPTIAAKAPGTLDNVQRQMVDRLGGLWNREFERILESRDVVRKLNELEGLLADAAKRREGAGNATQPVPPHTLPADAVLKAHLREGAAELKTGLEGRLRDAREGNLKLFDEIKAQRAEMEGMLKGVERVVKDLEGANKVLAGGEDGQELMEEVAEETRGAEGDIEMVLKGRERV